MVMALFQVQIFNAQSSLPRSCRLIRRQLSDDSNQRREEIYFTPLRASVRSLAYNQKMVVLKM